MSCDRHNTNMLRRRRELKAPIRIGFTACAVQARESERFKKGICMIMPSRAFLRGRFFEHLAQFRITRIVELGPEQWRNAAKGDTGESSSRCPPAVFKSYIFES